MGNTGEPLLIKSVRPKPPFDLTGDPSEAQVIQKLQEVVSHLSSVARYEDSRAALLNSNFVIEGSQISSLGVDRLTGGLISTTDIEVGSDKFLISSTNRRLTIKDDNNTTRVDLGRFGAGVAYGLKMYDDSGNIIVDIDGLGTDVVGNLQIASGAVTGGKIAGLTIDNSHIVDSTLTGVKIQDATIGNVKIADLAATKITGQLIDAQILDVDWAKITNAAIEAADIVSLSATDITTGTLTADGSPVAIEITGSGALLFSSGGDAIFRPNTTDASVIRFESSGGGTVGEIRTTGAASNPTGIAIIAQGTGDDATLQSNSGDVRLTAGGNLIINASNIESTSSALQFIDHLEPSVDGTKEVGTPFQAWSDMHSYSYTTETGIEFGNMSFITEPYNIWSEQVMADNNIEWDEGLVIVTNDNVPRVLMGKNGMRTNLPPSDIDDPSVKKWKQRPEWYKQENGKFIKRMKRSNGKWVDDKNRIYSLPELRDIHAKWEERT